MPRPVSSLRSASYCAAAVLIAVTHGPLVRGAAGEELPARAAGTRLQRLVDELRDRLEITSEVTVALVAHNPRLASVERIRDRDGAFLLSIQDGFLDTLSPDEQVAVLAHELGHVWIFTNHPYLQTETLANRVALRVVGRDSLAGAYQKMWERLGTTGNLAQFLGEAPSLTVVADTTR